MTLLDFMHPHGSQAAIAAEPITDSPAVKTTVDSPPDVPPKIATEIESLKALPAAPAPEDVTTTSVDEPVKDDVNHQPTTTHAETGTEHTIAEPATNLEGVQADEPVEEAKPVEAPKPAEETNDVKADDKKAAAKEKVEKTKAEGKGFFARLLSGSKSPKKEKKVKTPKIEKTEPIVEPVTAEATPFSARPSDNSIASAAEEQKAIAEPKEVANVPAVVNTPVEPVVEALVAESSTAAVAETEPEIKASMNADIAPAPVTETVAADKPVEDAVANKEEAPKMPKTNRRLSARITGWAKGLGKKEQSTTPRDEVTKEEAELKTESTSPIADMAPTLDQPVLAEPIKIEQESESSSAPSAVPAVAATA